jgi:hypothetical protein
MSTLSLTPGDLARRRYASTRCQKSVRPPLSFRAIAAGNEQTDGGGGPRRYSSRLSLPATPFCPRMPRAVNPTKWDFTHHCRLRVIDSRTPYRVRRVGAKLLFDFKDRALGGRLGLERQCRPVASHQRHVHRRHRCPRHGEPRVVVRVQTRCPRP